MKSGDITSKELDIIAKLRNSNLISILILISLGIVILLRFHILNYFGLIKAGMKITLGEALSGNFLDNIYLAETQSGFSIFAPAFASIAGSTAFCDHYNSRFIRFCFIRVDRKRYKLSTLRSAGVMGGISIALPCTFISLFFLIYGKLNYWKDISEEYASVFDETVYRNTQFIWNGLIIMLFLIFLDFLYGSVWAELGLLISIIFPNRYVAMCFPLMTYLLAHLVLYRLNLVTFSPASMLMPAESFIPYQAYPIVYQILLLYLICCACSKLMDWRIAEC